MTAGTARTARRPRTWAGSGWAGTARPTTGVIVTTLWADERVYYPVHTVPHTPARHFAKGKGDPAFPTKLAVGADLVVGARAAGFAFRSAVRGLRVRGPGRVPRRTGRGGAAVRDGPQAAARDLGPRSGCAHPGGRGPCAGLGRAGGSRRLACGDPGLPRRACRDLVGRRRHLGRVGAGRRPAA
jgi:hypothetical protein